MTDDKLSGGDGAGEVSAADMRASHADRDQVVEILRDAAGDGRLTSEELDERVEAALSARTIGELAGLTRDLPISLSPADSSTRSTDVVEINQRFGTLHRTGSWVVPRRMDIRMVGGDVKLDFTEAVIGQDTLDIDVDLSIGGDLVIVTKPGIVVATDELNVRVGEVKVRTTSAGADVPVVLRVKVTGRLRGGDVVVRYPRRTLAQWMRGESPV
ncbi:DUF1707 SHOCT-like domain-containing protein [Streptomyces sp. CA-106131]|uniref:DUF1707 SHOCT-like domain-containing protein n=2 Tax=unclassified Streptomyces TaxID=2593676 RepID=UPI003D8CB250